MTRRRIRSKQESKIVQYRNGGDGFVQWCEENVCIPIYPEGAVVPKWCPMHSLPDTLNPDTGRSYKSFWEEQKEVARRALVMKNGRFIHRIIILCWPRGDGKSFFACLVQLWKFFNWPRQQIMLGANSKDQVKFVHYDVMRDLVSNSPNLLSMVGGKKNIKEKEIRMVDRHGNTVSLIRSISSFSGIVSNISGYTFSEMFDMKNPKFFVQLDGSIRNIPNALGVIDSTVSAKDHVLYKLYRTYTQKKDPTLFFHYRYSKRGDANDYWHPLMTTQQLESYREKFPFGEFERYFLNTWSAGAKQIFATEHVEGISYLGVNGRIGQHEEMFRLIKTKNDVLDYHKKLVEEGGDSIEFQSMRSIEDIQNSLWPVDAVYDLGNNFVGNMKCPVEKLEELGDLLDTDWAILAGFDRADPMTQNPNARSMFSVIAKGLPGSRKDPRIFGVEDSSEIKFWYFLLYIVNFGIKGLEEMKKEIFDCIAEYDGIDSICSERWGMWDLQPWCLEQGIAFEPVYPTYDRQKAAFSEVFTAVSGGRFKAPPIYLSGTKEEDVLREEMALFDHDVDRKWFGSPEKGDKYGVQDDAMYSVGWTIYGGREIGVDQFRKRKGVPFFGHIENPKNLLGDYS